MSGHSEWNTIKRKKEKTDAQRGRMFTKVIREITVAARDGGGDTEANPRLRAAIQAAKGMNMPAANIDKAIKRGTGELPGVTYEQVSYEGYGPGGVALLIETLTDNKNRTVADIRHILTRHNGSMGEVGCGGWMFDRRGMIYVSKDKADEEKLFMISADAGALDVHLESDSYEVTTSFEGFDKVKKALQDENIEFEQAELTMVPQTTIKLEGKDAEHMLKLMEDLEDHDDVQKVYANFDIAVEVMERLSA